MILAGNGKGRIGQVHSHDFARHGGKGQGNVARPGGDFQHAALWRGLGRLHQPQGPIAVDNDGVGRLGRGLFGEFLLDEFVVISRGLRYKLSPCLAPNAEVLCGLVAALTSANPLPADARYATLTLRLAERGVIEIARIDFCLITVMVEEKQSPALISPSFAPCCPKIVPSILSDSISL